jgi:hypothetical protein
MFHWLRSRAMAALVRHTVRASVVGTLDKPDVRPATAQRSVT